MPLKRDLIFVHIPKTGGQSVEQMMGLDPYELDDHSLCGSRALCHLTAAEIRDRIGPVRFAESFRFSIVRNPFDRLVSEYAYRVRQGTTDKTWHEFVAILDLRETRLRPQHEFLYCRGRRLVHHIFRFEQIHLVGPFLFGQPTPHVNASPRGHWQNYYTEPGLRDKVARLYAEDFRRFRYAH